MQGIGGKNFYAINIDVFLYWVCDHQSFESKVVSRQKLNCNRENIEVYRVKYDIFSIRIEFLATNDLDPVPTNQSTPHCADVCVPNIVLLINLN